MPESGSSIAIRNDRDRSQGTADDENDFPDEVSLSPRDAEAYEDSTKVLESPDPYRIPLVYLNNTKSNVQIQRESPLIVFINAKSGGQIGPRLATNFARRLGQGQVFDVAVDRPNVVLSKFWSNLLKAEESGDTHASFIRNNLRILVAGGDGTVTWVLSSIMDLALDPMPPIAVMPLGTGNDFSYNFGWGKSFEEKWVNPKHFYRTMSLYRDADVRVVDAWKCELFGPDKTYFGSLPHSLDVSKQSGVAKATGRFWNYFSIGLDAKAAYRFHSLRENHPHLTASRLGNQAWYGVFSCSTGWFCGAEPIYTRLKMRIKDKPGGTWRELNLSSSIRAVVLLNLQTYGGGRDIWGLTNTKSLKEKGLDEPAYDDGKIDILGFRSGWHTSCVMGQVSDKIHAKRLGQACEIEMLVVETGKKVLGEEDRSLSHMQLDGEPWSQAIPSMESTAIRWEDTDDGRLATQGMRIRISLAGQSSVLCNSSGAFGGKFVMKLQDRAKRLQDASENK